MNKQLEEAACLYVLDQLDRDERAAFEVRLTREPDLAALVRDLEPVLAHGIRTLPRREPAADTLDRIEARIDALPKTETAIEPRRRTVPFDTARTVIPLWRGWLALAGWGIAAVIAISLATLAIRSLRPSVARPVIVFVGMNADRNTFAELPLKGPDKDPDARFIELAALAGNFLKKPGDMPVKSGPTPGDNRAYALFDPGSRQGFIGIEQLPVVAENQRYHLWIVETSTGRIHDAGILPMDGASRGLYSFALGPDDSPQSTQPNFFITLEDDGVTPSPTQPQGKVVLGSRRI